MRIRSRSIKKILMKCIKLGVVLVPLAIFSPIILVLYIITGLIDVCRNKPADIDTIKRYFLGNGIFTWLLSPINVLLDLISFRNPGIYKLTDLPPDYQTEIAGLLNDFNEHSEFIKAQMASRLSEIERGMLFFKWYGDNLETLLLFLLSINPINT